MLPNSTFLIKGFFIGISIAAPIGPISILRIKRTLSNSLISILISGLGAATADGVYSFLAIIGISKISKWLFYLLESFQPAQKSSNDSNV
jgi:threonine/homoserine/homoserine lactone efflux protein